MKITRVLKVEEAEFYDYLEREILADLNENTLQHAGVKKIQKGMTYKKNQESKHASVEVAIQEYKRGNLYKAKVRTGLETMTITYETVPEKEGLKIDFDLIMDNFESKKRNRFMKMFSEGVYLGRMTDTLYRIQEEIETYRSRMNEHS